MRNIFISVVIALFIVGTACAFAAESQKTEPVKAESATDVKKAVPEKSSSETKIRNTAPLKTKNLDKNAAKLANAVLPKVVYPTMTHHFAYEGKKFSITVSFNTDMDRNTVIAGSTVIFDFPKAANSPGVITWINDREFKWEQQSGRSIDICKYDPDCEFKLTLTDGIRSKEGLKLDGNNDNKQGGNYTLWFIDIG